MPFLPNQRPAAPWSQHNWWGKYSDSGALPNTLGSDTQQNDLQSGDTAWVESDAAIFVCLDPTIGAAVWSIVSGSGGSQNANSPRFFDDFLSSNFESSLDWNQISNGSGSGTAVNASSQAEISGNHPGVIQASTGTSAGGRGGLYLGRTGTSVTGSMRFDPNAGALDIEWMIRTPVLSDGVNDFFVVAGFDSNTGGGAGSNGLFFRLFATGNWEAVARSTSLGTQTVVPTSVPPTTDWTRLRVQWDPVNGARYYIGPSPGAAQLVATIPPGSPGLPNGQLMSPLVKIQKQAGTLARLMFVDYCSFGYDLVPGR
jgi:hypothetical protein